MTPKTARSYLLYQLQSQLYGQFYILGGEASTIWGDGGGSGDTVSFVKTLSAANAGTGTWECGWAVLGTTPGVVTVQRGGLTLWVRPEDCVASQGRITDPGSQVQLHLPKEFLGISPGYYMALSDEADAAPQPEALVRMYWNLTALGAESFVRNATRLLNEARLFFRLKVLSDPRSYTRCDAGVVYFRKSESLAVIDILRQVYPQVVRQLKPRTPIFTKTISAGVGLAEDPGKGESFGQHRCGLLADGMIRAHEQGVRPLDQRLDIVMSHYASQGIRPSQPYLNPDSTDVYVSRGWD